MLSLSIFFFVGAGGPILDVPVLSEMRHFRACVRALVRPVPPALAICPRKIWSGFCVCVWKARFHVTIRMFACAIAAASRRQERGSRKS